MTKPIAISAIIPCYNEEGNVLPLLAELVPVLQATGLAFEVVYVDDASTDGTDRRVLEAMQTCPQLRLVSHTRNCGQSAALLSGIAAARGEILLTMDADLQNDPADVPAMLEAFRSCDAVTGVRRRREDSTMKRLSSRIANRFRDWVLDDGIHDAGCNYRVFRKQMMEGAVPFRGLHRFLPTLWKWQGYKVVEMTVNHGARHQGISKYGTMNRLWVGIGDVFAMRWYRRRMVPVRRTEEGIQQ